MSSMFKRLKLAWGRRYYYLHKLRPVEVPAHNLSWTPDGYRVQRLGQTGVRLVEHFCTPAEADRLIARAASGPLIITAGDVFDGDSQTLLYRSAMLFGVPHTHVEKLVVARWDGGADARVLHEYTPDARGYRQHAMVVFLSDAGEQPEVELRFPALRLGIQPRVGRAVCWSRNPGGDNVFGLAGAPAGDAAGDIWVLQLWLNEKARLPRALHLGADLPQARKGTPLTGGEAMPEGVWSPQDLDLEGVFGKPDKVKGML